MSFWNKVKEFFGVADTAPFEPEVWAAMVPLMERRQRFSPVDIAEEVLAGASSRTMDDLNQALLTIEALFDAGKMEPYGYTRSMVAAPGGVNWVYHPASESAEQDDDSAPMSAQPSSRRGKRPSSPKKRKEYNPYEANEILRLSAKEMRARALKIQPWKTAWIGRVDTIPPQTDERTALIDRGLILHGLLNEDQLGEIHRVGDLWLKHHEGEKLARTLAAKSADEALRKLREEAVQRKETKKREAAERKKRRAEAVVHRKATDISYLGPGVSSKLGDRRCHVESLEKLGLPVLAAPGDVARALGLSISELRWLCFHNEAAERTHYVQFEVPKRSGGMRLLSAPLPKLAKAQNWILKNVLEKLPVEEPAHGFVPNHSTVTNARPHQAKDVVINLDLKDFFPSITFPRVRGVFIRVGYSPCAATLLALLCTESPRRAVSYDRKRYMVAVGDRALPQGACTSPALSNQVAKRLDRRLSGLARKHAWTYTRYADDLTFSAAPGSAGKRKEIPLFLARVRHVIEDERFAIQIKKGRVQRAGGRQTVTGIVVNASDHLSLPRKEVRRLRAIVHNAKKTGLEAQNRDKHPHFRAWLRGKIAYLSMVDRMKGDALRAALDERQS